MNTSEQQKIHMCVASESSPRVSHNHGVFMNISEKGVASHDLCVTFHMKPLETMMYPEAKDGA